jgi:hypothetical protein
MAVKEYRALVKLYRENPRDICVQLIFRKYNSSETDLDRMRCDYFEQKCGTQKACFTRSGDPVAFRLAQDIYNIISVTEGNNFNILKNMISTAKVRKQNVGSDKADRKMFL